MAPPVKKGAAHTAALPGRIPAARAEDRRLGYVSGPGSPRDEARADFPIGTIPARA